MATFAIVFYVVGILILLLAIENSGRSDDSPESKTAGFLMWLIVALLEALANRDE
jgi:hypothetical protein